MPIPDFKTIFEITPWVNATVELRNTDPDKQEEFLTKKQEECTSNGRANNFCKFFAMDAVPAMYCESVVKELPQEGNPVEMGCSRNTNEKYLAKPGLQSRNRRCADCKKCETRSQSAGNNISSEYIVPVGWNYATQEKGRLMARVAKSSP